MENTNEAPRGDLSIGDLRSMLGGESPAAPAPETPQQPASEAPETSEESTAESAPETKTEQGSDPESKGSEEGKPEGEVSPGVQKRIDKAIRAQREAERKTLELERRLAEVQVSRPATETAPAGQPPKIEDFNDVTEFLKAEARYRVAEATQAEVERSANEARQREQQAIQASHLARIEKAKETYQDYEATISAAQNLDISNEIVQQILHSDHGPDVAYYLAKHPAELARIMALHPVRHAAEFGKLETRFTSPPTKPQPAKALPKPAATVGGSPSTREPDLHDRSLDFSTFKRLAKARMAG